MTDKTIDLLVYFAISYHGPTAANALMHPKSVLLSLIRSATALTLAVFAGAGWCLETAPEVGIAAVDIEPAIGVPLAGYGAKSRRLPGFVDWKNRYPGTRYFKPSTGRHSAIRSKAMVIRNGDEQLVFVSVDFVGVEYAMTRDLAERLAPFGVTEDNLIISGTHTHHGPGSTTRRFALAIAAVDSFNRDAYDSIMDKVQSSVELAFARLTPSELLRTSFRTDGIQRNKFRRKDEGHFDDTARLLLARSLDTGALLGGMVNYPLHGNGMPVADLRFSSDVLGQIELRMEELISRENRADDEHPVVLFMNGAQGDVGNPVRSEEAVMSDGVKFAEQAAEARIFERLEPVDATLAVQRSRVWLGVPGYSLKICAKEGSFLAKYGLGLKIPLFFLYPQKTYITAASIGDILMLTVPGEPSTQVGYTLRETIADLGHGDPWILGLANDYMAYFTTRDEYSEGEYDSCSSLFGWKGAERIQAKYVEMLGANEDTQRANDLASFRAGPR